MKRKSKDYLLIGARGVGMGAADIIPGVSGGTVAFITGIYEELVNSIKSINLSLLKTLMRQGVAAAWRQVNGNFLFSVLAGILFSLFTLAKLLSWLLANHKLMVWAFFFGLIVGSVIFIGKTIKKWSSTTILSLVAGTFVAFYVTIATPATTPEALWFVFVSGALAICAMILPGISGAFILLLLGKYEYMLNALKRLEVLDIVVFALGCAVGIVAFSNVISWLFSKYRNTTLALLTGFMVGSLNKLWPWKQVVVSGINSKGEEVALLEKSILPGQYQQVTGESSMFVTLIAVALLGMLLVLVFDFVASRKKQQVND